MQLALGIVGGILGSFIGMPQLGFMIGSAIGGVVEANKQRIEGPRINDLKVQASQYGSMIPILHGTNRVAGNVIFCTDLREVSKSQRQGKGGGPKVTTYSYNVDIAVLLCRGTMYGIRKCWANSKLIYDTGSDASAGAVIASTLHAKSFTFYPGDEDQLPDPTIEATIGAGRTPAYRGTCYVVFNELDCPNGQIPQLAFEVMEAGDTETLSPVFSTAPSPLDIGAVYTRASITADGAAQFYVVDANMTAAPVYFAGPDYVTVKKLVDFSLPNGFQQMVPVPTQGGNFAMKAEVSMALGEVRAVVVFDLKTGEPQQIFQYAPAVAAEKFSPKYAAYDSVSGKFCAVGGGYDSGANNGNVITIMPGGVKTPTLDSAGAPMAYYDEVIYTVGERAGITYLQRYSGVDGSFLGETAYPGGAAPGTGPFLVHAFAGGVYVMDGSGGPISYDRGVWRVDDSAWHVLTLTAHFENSNYSTTTFFGNDRFVIVGPTRTTPASDDVEYRLINYAATEGVAPTLATIVTRICADAGLSPAQLDVTDLVETVHGYPITRIASARGNLDPLLRGYFIDPVESDGKLKFHKRAAQAIVAVIPWDELGAVEAGGEPADALPLTRTQEAELPRKVSVSFINRDDDYLTGTESSTRQIVDTINEMVDELPIATSPDHAASVAAVWQYDAWNSRNRRTFTLQRKYAALDAADIVAIPNPAGGYATVLRLTKVADTGLRLECEGEPADQELYTTLATGTTPAGGQTVDALPGPTDLTLLDIPILRDEDNDAGLYAAMDVLGNTSRGSELFEGDDASSMVSRGRVSRDAVVGRTVGALPDWDANMIDEAHVLQVNLPADAVLTNITHAQLLTTTQNAFALGADGRWEICQFREAADLGDGLWSLRGLKRGGRGTEYVADSHQVGDEFVMLQLAGMLRVRLGTDDIDAPRSYSAVSVGLDPSSADVEVFTNTAQGLKPFSVANLDVDQDGNSLTISWVRRTRLAENWLAGRVPLGEAVEAYEIEVEVPTGGITVYEASSSPVTLEVSAYAPLGIDKPLDTAGAKWAVVVGGNVYAAFISLMYKNNATTLAYVDRVGSSSAQITTDGTYIYSVNQGNPPGGIFPTVQKFDQSLALLDTETLTQLADGNALIYAGGGLWVSEPYANKLQRLSPSTLSTVASVTMRPGGLATDGTYVYAIHMDGAASRVYKVNPGTNLSVLDFPIGDTTGFTSAAIAVAGGLVWIAGQNSLHAFSATTGAEAILNLAIGGWLSAAGDYVAVHDAPRSGADSTVWIVDATTQKIVGSFVVPGTAGVPYPHNVTLLTEDRAIVFNGVTTDYYDRSELDPGTLIRVYQMSAIVGRGNPAEVEL